MGKMKATHRLPDGATFDVRYNATEQQWSGTLAVSSLLFEAKAKGVFNLLVKLDRAFHRAVGKVETKP